LKSNTIVSTNNNNNNNNKNSNTISNISKKNSLSQNQNSTKLSIDSGVGTVLDSGTTRKESLKSGTTLIHVNPARSQMHSNRSNDETNFNFVDNSTLRNNKYCYSYYDYDENNNNDNDNNDFEDEDFINDDIFSKSNRIKLSIGHNNNSVNNAGYCVDSVEPKCNELKRLIDEFKLKYATKLKLVNDNKLLTEKLNIVI